MLTAAAGCFLPRGSGLPPAEVARRALELLSRTDARTRRDFALVLRLVESRWTGLAASGRFERFSRAGEERRARRMRFLQHSRLALLRTAYTAVHRICCACFYADAASWPGVGYPGPPGLP